MSVTNHRSTNEMTNKLCSEQRNL